MADKRTGSEAPGGRRRKRAAPTIELTATDVTAAEAQAASESQSEPSPAEAATSPASEPPPPEPPPEPPKEAAGEEPPVEPVGAEPSVESEATAELPPPAGPAPYFIALVAGIAGVVITIGVLAALWYGGLLPLAGGNQQAAQITALQSQVQALQNRPPAPDSKAIDALRARVNQLNGEIAKLPPSDKTVGERLAAADNALKSFGGALTALSHRNDDIAAEAQRARQRADAAEKAVSDLRASLQNVAKSASGGGVAAATLAALQKRVAALEVLPTRVAALEQSMKAARSTLVRNAALNRAARLAVSAAALRDLVVSGQPYAAALAQVKALGADAKALAPLAAFADQGVPGKAALAHQLSALIPAMLKTSGQAPVPRGFLDRLQANASKLVRIEPVAAPQGDTSADVLARIQAAAAKADIDRALADLAKLPDAMRAPAQGWIAKANARRQALATARRFAADTARALAKS